MNRCSKGEVLLERAALCCFNLSFMLELSHGDRPLPPQYFTRLHQEMAQELRTLETMLETLQDEVAHEHAQNCNSQGNG